MSITKQVDTVDTVGRITAAAVAWGSAADSQLALREGASCAQFCLGQGFRLCMCVKNLFEC